MYVVPEFLSCVYYTKLIIYWEFLAHKIQDNFLTCFNLSTPIRSIISKNIIRDQITKTLPLR